MFGSIIISSKDALDKLSKKHKLIVLGTFKDDDRLSKFMRRIEERAENAATVSGELGEEVVFVRVDCCNLGDLCSICAPKKLASGDIETVLKVMPAIYIFIQDGVVVDRAGVEALGAANSSPKKFVERMRKSFNIPKKEKPKPVASSRPEVASVSFSHHWNPRPADKISPRVRPRNRL